MPVAEVQRKASVRVPEAVEALSPTMTEPSADMPQGLEKVDPPGRSPKSVKPVAAVQRKPVGTLEALRWEPTTTAPSSEMAETKPLAPTLRPRGTWPVAADQR